uniref:Uncharacterized protein n=1 Tax=Knipowitschia caucasica TaxID=637954 RepID=A0AAV2IZ40_KNICA
MWFTSHSVQVAVDFDDFLYGVKASLAGVVREPVQTREIIGITSAPLSRALVPEHHFVCACFKRTMCRRFKGGTGKGLWCHILLNSLLCCGLSGSSYFFKGKEYWRVPSSDMEAEAGFPRLIAKDWLLCTEMQSDSPEPEPKSPESRGNVHGHPDHAENGYEVCSCTSDSASPLRLHTQASPLWLLGLALWTLGHTLTAQL